MQLTFDDFGKLYDDFGHVVGKIYCPGVRPSDISEIKKVQNKTVYIDDFKPKNAEQLAAHVVYLQHLEQPEQRTPEWYKMRESRLTASDLAGAIGDSNYDTPFDILVKKCGGGPAFTGNAATQWGVKYEPVATSIYEFFKQTDVIEFGLLPHPTIPFLGASPDGITPAGKMLEIKCPMRRTITGVVPHHYWIQMQLQLEVCDLEECDFEECKFVEYQNGKDFFLDAGLFDKRLTRDGSQKGILLEWYDRVESKPMYEYCPGRIYHSSDVQKWISQTRHRIESSDSEHRYIFRTITYWKLDTYSCVLVKRDRQWWNGVLPRIKAFWREVSYYRTQPIEILYRDHGKDLPCIDLEDDTDAPQPPPFLADANPFLTSDDEGEAEKSKQKAILILLQDSCRLKDSGSARKEARHPSLSDSSPLQRFKSEPIRNDVRFCSDSEDD